MIVYRVVRKMMSILTGYMNHQEKKSYIADIIKSYGKLSSKKKLTNVQIKEIQDYFLNLLGYKVPTMWHQYFYSRTNNYSKLYIPTSEYKVNIVGRLNIYPLKRAYTDKNITDIILPSSIQPKTYLKNINGYFYIDGKPITKQDAISLCANLGEVIIKPSLTARGKGVAKHNLVNGISRAQGISIDKIFEEYKKDFLIQECVSQHKDMAALNPTSLNTIRIMTYRAGMDIKVIYSVIRIGRKGAVIDNESAGGISTIIKEDGRLGQYAYGAPGIDNIEFTDTGIRLLGYLIPSYKEALQMVKDCHYKLPYFDLLAWDVAINENGSPILIEFNMTPDLSQSANGPAFGEYTEEILAKAMSRNNTYSEFGKNFMWHSF